MIRTVMLCDDEIHILKAVEFKLTKAGYRVLAMHDGADAWERMQTQLPDLVITDLQMPRMTGFELAEKMRADPRTRHIPLIMLTAKGYELADQDVARRFGVIMVLTKPFSPRELLELVEHTFAQRPQAAAGAVP
jgi:CheY-like chemotaxis protein